MFQDKEIIRVIIAGTLLMLFLGCCIILFVVLYKRRQNSYQKERHRMEEKFQQELLRTQLEIQEQTLRNIGLEIHDNIGQTLSLVKLNMNTIELEERNKAEEKIIHSRDLVSKAIVDLRSLSKTLNADSILSAGLLKAIEFELNLVDKAGEFKTELNIKGSPVKLDPKKELILFRIVQEALNNVIKHSNATSIVIEASFEGSLEISVHDNGIGFNRPKENGEFDEGSGLQNMRNRAKLIGGSFSIRSSDSGTTIQITAPINYL